MMTEDEFDPLPADMMRKRHYHGHDDIPPAKLTGRLVWQPYMIEDGRIIDGCVYAEPLEDKAVEARAGGRMLVHWPHARVWTLDTLTLSATLDARGANKATALPESAFDWPVYRAAMDQSQCPLDVLCPLYAGGPGRWDGVTAAEASAISESELRALHGDR